MLDKENIGMAVNYSSEKTSLSNKFPPEVYTGDTLRMQSINKYLILFWQIWLNLKILL